MFPYFLQKYIFNFYTCPNNWLQYKLFMRSNLDFAKLASAGHMSSFDKYMEVGKVEIGGFIVLASALMGIDDIDEVEGYGWLKSRSKLLQSLAEMLRLMNDIPGYEVLRNKIYVLFKCFYHVMLHYSLFFS